MASKNTKQEKIQQYIEKLKEWGYDVDEELLKAIVDLIWPAPTNADAEFVACTEEHEMQRVVDFLWRKLDLDQDPEELLKVVQDLCEELNKKGIKKKYRALFYYLLVKKLGVEDKVLGEK
jgi:hypothetical protein